MTQLTPKQVASQLREAAVSQSRSVRTLMVIAAQIIDHLMLQLAPKVNARGDVEFVVTSGYGVDNQQPFVQIAIAGQVHQLSPEQAAGHAMHILEAVEAAKTDALFYEFTQSELKMDPTTAAKWLVAMRAYRQKRDGTSVQSA